MDDNNKKDIKDEKGKDLSSQLDKLLGALNFSRKEISQKKDVEENLSFDLSESRETSLQSEMRDGEEERENLEIDALFRSPEEELESFAGLEAEAEKSLNEGAGELDGLFTIREDANKASHAAQVPETPSLPEQDTAEQPVMMGFDEEVDIDQIKSSLEEFSNGREGLELHRVEDSIDEKPEGFQVLEPAELPPEKDLSAELSKAQLTNEDIEVRNGIVIEEETVMETEESERSEAEEAEQDERHEKRSFFDNPEFSKEELFGMSVFADSELRKELVAGMDFEEGVLTKQEEGAPESETRKTNIQATFEVPEEREPADENKLRREGYRSLDQQIKKEMGADIEKLKQSGYKPQGFVFDEGVNSKTVPEVAKIVEITSDGRIDFDKVVGGNRLLKIDSIYDFHHLIKQMSDTVFMIELYSRTMPPNIPSEVKRESVLNIIKASSIQIEDLLQDAYQRIDVLNEVLEDVAQKAEELDKQNAEEIERLEEQIQELKFKMQKRANFKQSQNAMIGYEIQRIVNIVEFIEP